MNDVFRNPDRAKLIACMSIRVSEGHKYVMKNHNAAQYLLHVGDNPEYSPCILN